MKKISRIVMGGAFTIILIAAACAPIAGQAALNLPGPFAQDDLTETPTAVGAETTTPTLVDTTLTPSTPGTGPEVISLDCQYCVDTVAHAQLLIPRDATFEVISPPELANNGDEDGEDDDDNGEGRRLRAQLSGAAEVPGPGDPDGSGTARITLRPEEGEACFELSVSNIEPATAAHIHEGAEGVAGPVVIPLDPAPTAGSSEGCVSGVDTALLRNILQNPRQYYVNVHNEEFPDGAVRGQLRHVDDDDDDDDNGDRMGCRTIDRFRDTKLVLCRAEENTIITLNVCQDDACREVQLTLQSCTLGTGTPSPTATITTTTPTAVPTLTPITPTATLTFTPVVPTIQSPTATVPTNTSTATATSTSTATSTPTPTSTLIP
jgi:hypothetical protein